MAVPSYPQVHVTGPVHTWVQVPGDQIRYLGTCEVTPQVQLISYAQDAMNDLAGKTLPFQRTDDGSEAVLAMMVNYFSKSAVAAIKASGVAAGRQVRPGVETRWSRGGVKFGVTTFGLWHVFDNYFNPGGTTVGLEIGYYYPQCEWVNLDVSKMGTQVQSQLVVVHARPQFLPQANPFAVNASANERGWVLYSNVPSDFPADVRIPQ